MINAICRTPYNTNRNACGRLSRDLENFVGESSVVAYCIFDDDNLSTSSRPKVPASFATRVCAERMRACGAELLQKNSLGRKLCFFALSRLLQLQLAQANSAQAKRGLEHLLGI